MTREEVDALIALLEAKAARHPTLFKWRVGFLALLGYTYLLGMLAISLGFTAAVVFVVATHPSENSFKIGVVLVILSSGVSWAVLRGVFVRIERPKGLALTRSDCPELFRIIDRLRKQLQAPRFHRVILIPEHSAEVVQTPRLGVFGWYHNSLLLGLPLMQGTTAEEFEAILAHEFAHLSGNHGKFGTWIYRLRQTWERVFNQLEKQEQGFLFLRSFILWFWPRFNAHAFVLSRQQEYEADAIAARITSAEAVASGLIRTYVQAHWLNEKFLPEFFSRAREIDAPPRTLFYELGQGLRSLHTHPDSSRWLTQAFIVATNNVDTHPCMKDRLRALPTPKGRRGFHFPPASLPKAPSIDAATALLGEKQERLVQHLTDEWTGSVTAAWKERHLETQMLSEELERLEATEGKNSRGLWARATIILDRDGDDAAEPLIDQILGLDPNHPGANLIRGRVLLKRNDEEGVSCIEKAIRGDGMLTHTACESLYAYYTRTGQQEKLRPLEERADKHAEHLALSKHERSSLSLNDVYLGADLSERETEQLREIARQHPEIASVNIVRRKVTYFPENPMYVIVLTLNPPRWFRRGRVKKALVNHVVDTLRLRGNWLVFINEKKLRPVARRVACVSWSEIYRSETAATGPTADGFH